VSRLADFGAFVELMPGVDGLVHLSELSWDKRVRKPGDLLKVGDRVEVAILQINPADRRVGLGYKQVLGDPWEAVPQKFPDWFRFRRRNYKSDAVWRLRRFGRWH